MLARRVIRNFSSSLIRLGGATGKPMGKRADPLVMENTEEVFDKDGNVVHTEQPDADFFDNQSRQKFIAADMAADAAAGGPKPMQQYQRLRKSYTTYTGVPVEADPLPKIEALHRRIHRILAEMPEDYIYRTTLEGILSEDSAKIQQFGGDLTSLEKALGHNDIEMYMRQLKMELRCARTMADDQPWTDLFAPAPKDQWKWPI